MRTQVLVSLIAVVGLSAAPALAVVVQWSDFEVGTNYGLGLVGENMVAPAGYGPPTSYGLDATIKTTGNTSQRYHIPGQATFDADPDGEGWMIPGDGGGAFDPTDWDDFIVNVLGGPAPAPNSPISFIGDIRIDVATPADYDVLEWFPLHNAPSSTFQEFDPLDDANDSFNTWKTDFVFLTSQFDGTGNLSFILILDSKFAINNPFGPSDATFYIDNFRIEYVPEPASALLLGLGAAALLRRRRGA